MFSIAVIATEAALQRIDKINDAMQKECHIEYLIYDSFKQLKDIYRQNCTTYDAFLFSGFFSYSIVTQGASDALSRPHAYFTLSDRDYYKMVAKIAIRYPKVDFSRVFFGEIEVDVDFADIFQDSPGPIVERVPEGEDFTFCSPSQETSRIYKDYKLLWESGKIDLVITRYSSIIPRLERENIPYEYLSPSRESMLDTFNSLLARLRAERASDISTTYCLISPENGSLNETHSTLLANALAKCNKIFGGAFLIRQEANAFELTTTSGVLNDVTSQHTLCPVTAYLREQLDFPFCVGWGSADDVVLAHKNALRAVRESRNCVGHPAFIVMGDNHIIGPLSSTRRLSYTDNPNLHVSNLSEKTGLSAVCLSRIMSVMHQRDDNTISAEELAYYMNLTTRSTSRMLKKLVDSDLATVVYSRQINLRGRPANIYRIDLDD